jgi:hypothetical protein
MVDQNSLCFVAKTRTTLDEPRQSFAKTTTSMRHRSYGKGMTNTSVWRYFYYPDSSMDMVGRRLFVGEVLTTTTMTATNRDEQ